MGSRILRILPTQASRGQDEEASPDMRHEKACKHHLQHDEEQDRVSGGDSDRTSGKLI